jgi:hypothetical protein
MNSICLGLLALSCLSSIQETLLSSASLHYGIETSWRKGGLTSVFLPSLRNLPYGDLHIVHVFWPLRRGRTPLVPGTLLWSDNIDLLNYTIFWHPVRGFALFLVIYFIPLQDRRSLLNSGFVRGAPFLKYMGEMASGG